jgi:hypothetical protein
MNSPFENQPLQQDSGLKQMVVLADSLMLLGHSYFPSHRIAIILIILLLVYIPQEQTFLRRHDCYHSLYCLSILALYLPSAVCMTAIIQVGYLY